MALQFVMGRSGSGKSYELYQKVIKESMKHPEKSYYVVVPEQFTMQTQKDLVTMHPNHGISNIDVLSFMRLAYRVFEEQGGMKRTVLEDTGKSMLVRRVITEKKDDLKIFQNYAKKPGYISEIKSLLSEFYQYDIDEQKIGEMLGQTDRNPILQRKLEDMQVIYQGFEEQLAEKYITTEEVLDVLTEQLGQTELFQNATLALDGFTGFTPIQYKLLRRLLHLCDDVLVTVTIDPKESVRLQEEEFALYHLSREMIDKLSQIASEEGITRAKDCVLDAFIPYRFRGNPYLACLERNLYGFQKVPLEQYTQQAEGTAEENIEIFAGKHMQEEVDHAVRAMKYLIMDEKYRYREIAVVTGDMPSYSRLLEQAFEKERIPYFMDYKKDILGNPMVELLRTLIQMFVRDFSYEEVFRYLRCGLVDMQAEDVDKLENYVLAMGIKRYSRWKKPFLRPFVERKKMTDEEKQESLALYNEYRETFMGQLEGIVEVFRKKTQTVKTYTVALHTYLVQHKIFEKLKVYQENFEQQQQPGLAKEYAQVYEQVMGIFDKLVHLLGDEVVTLAEYGDLLETGFEEVKVGLIPPGVDQIVVGDIERTRLKDIKALFFLGVNEGIVPKSGSKGGILSDQDREILQEQNVTLAPTARQTVFTQQFYLYLNLTKPQKKLYLSYHKVNAEGKPALASGLIRTVQKIFSDLQIREDARIATCDLLDPGEFSYVLGKELGKEYLLEGLRKMEQEQPADWWKQLYSHYFLKDEWQEKMEQLVDGVGFVNVVNPLTKQVAEALYGKELKNSVTRIEKYVACAYAHFLQYGLCLKERAEYQFGGVDFGNVFHRVLRMLPQQLQSQGMEWRSAEQEALEQAVHICLLKVTEEYGNDVLLSSQKNRYLIERMERILNRTVWALGKQLQEGQFEPAGYEIYFTSLDGLDAARMDLGEERVLRLNGQIDRMDQYEEEEEIYIKVIDYKSGKMTVDLENLYHGLQMQLVVYMNAAKELEHEKHKEKNVHTAGIFYYNLDDPMVEREETEDAIDQALLKELRMNGLVNKDAHVIALLDRAFQGENGLSPSTKSWVIPVETLKGGEIGKRSKVASEEEFALMGDYVNHKITRSGTEILNGSIGMEPYRKDKKEACAYCAYRDVCNFDTRLPGNAYRVLKKMQTDEILQAMKEELKGDHEDGK